MMSIAETGRFDAHIRTVQATELQHRLMLSLVKKAEHFFIGDYQVPTPRELGALRKFLQFSKEDAAHTIGLSVKTWTKRETSRPGAQDESSGMLEQEFSLVVLFLLRSTDYWDKINTACLDKIDHLPKPSSAKTGKALEQ